MLSLSFICFVSVFCYITYTVCSIAILFVTPSCPVPENCFKSYLYNNPSLDLYIFSSPKGEAKQTKETQLVDHIKNFPYFEPWEKKIDLNIPSSVRNNGSLYFHMFAVPSSNSVYNYWYELAQNNEAVYFKIRLTQLHTPDYYIFNLLNDKDKQIKEEELEEKKVKKHSLAPVSHLKSKVTFNILTDPLILPQKDLPQEIYYYVRLTQDRKFLPIVIYNFLETRLEDLKMMKNSTEEILLKYEPIYFGKFRFIIQLESTILTLRKMGFSARDLDDIKGLFASTNLYLLCLTVVISSFHLLFDFLAFKNDIRFWRNKSTMEGLSYRTVLWRAFSQAVILLYLLDEQASNIVLIPTGIGTCIEFWKVMKVMKRKNSKESSDSEKQTNEYDAESMKYLSFLLYPLCLAGAVYSLIYQPHKSWYSWCIHSLVNCVYAFGFLFMLPQLFINYRLKSVEALPWRSFMYKAFNTFIDDVFAFIISMPTAHRVACFRDDLIFLVYLYQRWLYPVDKSRTDEKTEALLGKSDKKELKEKKEK